MRSMPVNGAPPPGSHLPSFDLQFRVSFFVLCRAFGSRFPSHSFSRRREFWQLNFDLSVSGIIPMKKMFFEENLRGDNLRFLFGKKKKEKRVKKKSEIVATFKFSSGLYTQFLN